MEDLHAHIAKFLACGSAAMGMMETPQQTATQTYQAHQRNQMVAMSVLEIDLKVRQHSAKCIAIWKAVTRFTIPIQIDVDTMKILATATLSA